jgi:hypothetical protein
MVERLSAAICGVGIVLLCSSVAIARSEIRGIQSVYGTIVGATSMYNPFQSGYREGGIETGSFASRAPSCSKKIPSYSCTSRQSWPSVSTSQVKLSLN